MKRICILSTIGWFLSLSLLSLPLLAQSPLSLDPIFLCRSGGFVAFNPVGGDGTTITYSATGVTLSSPTSSTGIADVDASYQQPNTGARYAIIEATQSGVTISRGLTVLRCTPIVITPNDPVFRRAPIPDITANLNEPLASLDVGQYLVSHDNGYDYRAGFKYRAYGLPPGIKLFDHYGLPPGPGDTPIDLSKPSPLAYAILSGTPTLAGTFPVTIVATKYPSFQDPYSIADTFNLTVSGGTLPVTLISFTAKPLPDQTVQLNWMTSLERDNKSFLVERSKNSTGFEPVGEVSRQETNDQGIKNYQLLDKLPYAGTSYYRLTQIDVSGKRTSYPLIPVVLRDSPYQIRPNPVTRNGQFTVLLDEPDSAIVTLSRVDGRAVSFRKTTATSQSITLRLIDQPTVGLYIVTVEERGQSRQHRLLIE